MKTDQSAPPKMSNEKLEPEIESAIDKVRNFAWEHGGKRPQRHEDVLTCHLCIDAMNELRARIRSRASPEGS